MKNLLKVLKVFKCLEVSEIVILGTIFLAIAGWVYQVNAQMAKGNDRDEKLICIESKLEEMKIDVAETKMITLQTNKTVEILLTKMINNEKSTR